MRPDAPPKRKSGVKSVDVDRCPGGDNVDAADSLAQRLRLMGHTINVAYGGIEAIDAAEAFRPEIVLLKPVDVDQLMECIDGFRA